MYAIRSYYVSLDFQAKYNTNLVDDMLENSILFEVDNDLKLSTLGREDFLIVITSYSIHYTKLYERFKFKNCFGKSGGRSVCYKP